MIERITGQLEGVRTSGRGFIACCPAHNDRKPSLSIYEGDNGQILLHCFAGCTTKEVCAAMGLEVADLFPDKRNLSRAERKELSEAQRRQRARRRFEAKRREAFLAMIEFRDLTESLYDYYKLDFPDEEIWAVHILPLLDYYLQILAIGPGEELLELLRTGVINRWQKLYNLQKRMNA